MSAIVPDSVTTKAQGLIDLYGNCLELFGRYQGREVYRFCFPAKDTGYPFVYLYDAATSDAVEVTGSDALHILSAILRNQQEY